MSYRVLDVVFMGEMVGVSKSGKNPTGSDSSSSAQRGHWVSQGSQRAGLGHITKPFRVGSVGFSKMRIHRCPKVLAPGHTDCQACSRFTESLEECSCCTSGPQGKPWISLAFNLCLHFQGPTPCFPLRHYTHGEQTYMQAKCPYA